MKKITVFSLIVLMGCIVPLYAQVPGTGESTDQDAIKQANNPLASIKTVNVHNYFTPMLSGVPNATIDQIWLRYAQPIGPIIFRVSMPAVVESFPWVEPQAGLGDLNAFVMYKLPLKTEGIDLGIGPAITFPTGTNSMGAGKWQLGASAVVFFMNNPVIQWGSLVTWQMSIAGDEDRSDVNMLTPQLFFMWQIGGGTYLRSTAIWTFDFINEAYNIPIGLGIGKVVKSGNLVFNIFLEPQVSVFTRGLAQPKLQVFMGFNTQIL